jgi:hypothetical protein
LVQTRPDAMKRITMSNSFDDNPQITEDMLEGPLPYDRMVLRTSNEACYYLDVWFRDSYIRREWSRYFEIVDIADNAHSSYQSVVLLRPPAST